MGVLTWRFETVAKYVGGGATVEIQHAAWVHSSQSTPYVSSVHAVHMTRTTAKAHSLFTAFICGLSKLSKLCSVHCCKSKPEDVAIVTTHFAKATVRFFCASIPYFSCCDTSTFIISEPYMFVRGMKHDIVACPQHHSYFKCKCIPVVHLHGQLLKGLSACGTINKSFTEV